MNDLKETVFKITNTITKTSGELLKSAKLTINLSSEEDKLKALHQEIGKKVCEIYAYGGSLGAAFDETVKAVEAQEQKIRDIKARIDEVKGTKPCPGCGKPMDKNSEFCPKCGHRHDGAYAAPPEAPPESVPPINPAPAGPKPASSKVCGLCGKENDASSKFCFHCGRVL